MLDLPNVQLLHLDDLAKMSDKTILERKKHVPHAERIIKEMFDEFSQWIETKRFTPALIAVKKLMEDIQRKELEIQVKKNPTIDTNQAVAVSERLIQKLTNRMAAQLRQSNDTVESAKALKALFNISEK